MTTHLGRRAVLRGGLTGLGVLGLGSTAGCAGLTRRISSTRSGATDRLSVQVYGTTAETTIYQRLVAEFEDAHPGVAVDLTAVPFQEMFTGIDSGLLSGTAPDVFRVDYPTMGLYASTDQLLDVTDALQELASDVRPALMEAVSYDGRFYGVPQHVDTSALVYRPDLLRDAGVGAVPDRPEDAWTWEEFGRVADRLRDAAPDGSSAFAVNWQAAGAFRWLNWLFQAGGQVFDDDGTTVLLDGEPGLSALEFTASFFERGWVPPTTSTKSATYPDAQFTSGTLAMLFAGNFLVPAFADTIGNRFDYATTFLPRDERRAGELGGNALVATKQAANPELAADFLVFMSDAEPMRQFCSACVLLPTRESIAASSLDFATGGDLMGVYADQITTITDRDVADVTTPSFAEVNVDLTNELEETFLGGRDPGETLRILSEQIQATTSLEVAGSSS